MVDQQIYQARQTCTNNHTQAYIAYSLQPHSLTRELTHLLANSALFCQLCDASCKLTSGFVDDMFSHNWSVARHVYACILNVERIACCGFRIGRPKKTFGTPGPLVGSSNTDRSRQVAPSVVPQAV